MDYFYRQFFLSAVSCFHCSSKVIISNSATEAQIRGLKSRLFFCQFCRPLKSYRLFHTLKSSPPLPLSDLHLPSVHPHILLRSLSLCFALVSSLSFSFHSSFSLGGDLDSARPRGEEEEERCLSWGGKRITTWMMVCARWPYCDVQICRGRWGRRVGTSARGALRGNRLIMLWVPRMFNDDVNENRRDYSGQKQSTLHPHTWNMQILSACFPFEFHNITNMEERIRRK